MTGNFKKEDRRILKTRKALMEAMAKLLELRNFNQITVHDLCEEAMICRGTFYTSFADKYDLLKQWLATISPAIISNRDTYADIEKSVNDFAHHNKKIIKNLLQEANPETSELLRDFILSLLLKPQTDNTDHERINAKHTVFGIFCSGGMFDYLLWQVNSEFPAELPVMNTYLYDILALLLEWDMEQQ